MINFLNKFRNFLKAFVENFPFTFDKISYKRTILGEHSRLSSFLKLVLETGAKLLFILSGKHQNNNWIREDKLRPKWVPVSFAGRTWWPQREANHSVYFSIVYRKKWKTLWWRCSSARLSLHVCWIFELRSCWKEMKRTELLFEYFSTNITCKTGQQFVSHENVTVWSVGTRYEYC
jgi:hypothetical protein